MKVNVHSRHRKRDYFILQLIAVCDKPEEDHPEAGDVLGISLSGGVEYVPKGVKMIYFIEPGKPNNMSKLIF